MYIRFFLSISLLLFSMQAGAEISAPVTYTRTGIAIAVLEPPQEGKPVQASKIITLDVDVRPAESFRHQEGWFSLSSLAPTRGALVTYTVLTMAQLEPAQQYAALDVLLITQDGTIAQILPNLILAEMQQAIAFPQPILAILYLRGGVAAQSGIKPGDHVEYALFKKNPIMLGGQIPAASVAPLLQKPTNVSEPVMLSQPTRMDAKAAPVEGVSINDLLDQQLKKPIENKTKAH